MKSVQIRIATDTYEKVLEVMKPRETVPDTLRRLIDKALRPKADR